MRYHVRNASGEELVVPSLGDLHDLYVHGFLGDDDLVRADTAARWVRAGAMPALHGVRRRAPIRARSRCSSARRIALTAAIALLLGWR